MAVHLLLEEVVGPLTPKQIELLLAARQDADRILAMINDLLDLTRIEQGRVKLDLEPVPVGTLLDKAVARMRPQADDAGLTLEADAEAPDVAVRVDRDRIDHVFDNLVGNAIQHTPRGGSIRLSARPLGDVVQVAVHDTGKGISAEHLPRIFEKFYRVPGESAAGGAGLGLAIVREIIAAHSGRIDVASRPGHGATFTFTLPACPAAPQAASYQDSLSCSNLHIS
jgi:signal transduction histidine kinase